MLDSRNMMSSNHSLLGQGKSKNLLQLTYTYLYLKSAEFRKVTWPHGSGHMELLSIFPSLSRWCEYRAWHVPSVYRA